LSGNPHFGGLIAAPVHAAACRQGNTAPKDSLQIELLQLLQSDEITIRFAKLFPFIRGVVSPWKSSSASEAMQISFAELRMFGTNRNECKRFPANKTRTSLINT